MLIDGLLDVSGGSPGGSGGPSTAVQDGGAGLVADLGESRMILERGGDGVRALLLYRSGDFSRCSLVRIDDDRHPLDLEGDGVCVLLDRSNDLFCDLSRDLFRCSLVLTDDERLSLDFDGDGVRVLLLDLSGGLS